MALCLSLLSHPTRMREFKGCMSLKTISHKESHPTRMREFKAGIESKDADEYRSHPTRMREFKGQLDEHASRCKQVASYTDA